MSGQISDFKVGFSYTQYKDSYTQYKNFTSAVFQLSRRFQVGEELLTAASPVFPWGIRA